MNKVRYNFRKRIKRIWFLIDAKLFETTYKDEWERQNKKLDTQKLRITRLQKQVKELTDQVETLKSRKRKK